MQGRHLFEYAVIRLVPRVEREEFINVGVILWCPAQQFLHSCYELNKDKLQVLYGHANLHEMEKNLEAFNTICKGGASSGTIGRLPLHERFRWLTATRSTVVQTSKVHPGFCDDAGEMLNRLFTQLVC